MPESLGSWGRPRPKVDDILKSMQRGCSLSRVPEPAVVGLRRGGGFGLQDRDDAQCRLGRGPPGVPEIQSISRGGSDDDGGKKRGRGVFDDADVDEVTSAAMTEVDGPGGDGASSAVEDSATAMKMETETETETAPRGDSGANGLRSGSDGGVAPSGVKVESTAMATDPGGEGGASANYLPREPAKFPIPAPLPRPKVDWIKDTVPKQELNIHYSKMTGVTTKQVSELKSRNYTIWHNNGLPHEKKYTCVFSCPATGERFACGNWEHSKEVIAEGHVFWYQNMQLAKDAAAARALDCFSLRRCHGTDIEPGQRCVDAPYLTAEEAPPFNLPDGVTLPEMFPIFATTPPGNAATQLGGSIDGPPLRAVSPHPSSSETEAKSPALPPNPIGGDIHGKPPRKALHDWYDVYWRRASLSMRLPVKTLYVSWPNVLPCGERFTAVFTCPWTGERFASGKMVGEEDDYIEEKGLLGEDHEALPVNLVWYKTKKLAENAAAGRAYDCLIHRDTCVPEPNPPTYCSEFPYLVDAVPSDWDDASRNVTRVFWHDRQSKNEFRVTDWPEVKEERLPIQFRILADGENDKWRAGYTKSR